jgi:hypothetical protein
VSLRWLKPVAGTVWDFWNQQGKRNPGKKYAGLFGGSFAPAVVTVAVLTALVVAAAGCTRREPSRMPIIASAVHLARFL